MGTTTLYGAFFSDETAVHSGSHAITLHTSSNITSKYIRGARNPTHPYHNVLENIGKIPSHNARVQHWLECITAFNFMLC